MQQSIILNRVGWKWDPRFVDAHILKRWREKMKSCRLALQLSASSDCDTATAVIVYTSRLPTAQTATSIAFVFHSQSSLLASSSLLTTL
jgi:hypothetical protein